MSDFIPYGRQWIQEDDISCVVETLKSSYLTTGPKVGEFEASLKATTGAGNAIAIANGTAALHAAMAALGVGPGDEVIVPAITFAASANCVIYQGATPVFADVDPNTLLIDCHSVASKINSRTKAIVAVDYAGQPCEYDELRKLAKKHGLALVADACHSLGATYKGSTVGTLADITTLSFHPVKIITTGEGGACLSQSAELAGKMRIFRNHGITVDFRERQERNSWYYEIDSVGYNYRLPDLLCSLGISQLKKLDGWIRRRQEIANLYEKQFSNWQEIRPLARGAERTSAYHLYVVQLQRPDAAELRAYVFDALRKSGVGVNVHYIPVHLHPLYRRRFGYGEGMCPVAENSYQRILSLPIFPQMTDGQVDYVVRALRSALDARK